MIVGVLSILGVSEVLEIRDSTVRAITVAVIHLLARLRFAEKGGRHQSVDVLSPRRCALVVQVDARILPG